MTALAFAFGVTERQPLSFHFPVAVPEWSGIAILRNPRYAKSQEIPPSYPVILCGQRYRRPLPPFPGLLPPQNVRAGSLGIAWKPAQTAVQSRMFSWRDTQGAAVPLAVPLIPSIPQVGMIRIPLKTSALATGIQGYPWKTMDQQAATMQMDFQRAPETGTPLRSGWRSGSPLAQSSKVLFNRAFRCWQEIRSFWKDAVSRGTLRTPSWQRQAVLRSPLIRIPWQEARIRSQISWPWPALPPWIPPPARASLRFHFHAPVDSRLAFHFGREPSWVIPVWSSYRMTHTVTLVRLPDRTPIPVSALTLESAWDEWCWTLSATLVGPDAVDLLRPVITQAVEVEVVVDGYSWQFRLDQIASSAEFAKTGGQTQGRSRAALLGPEIALAANGYETEAKTARQLAEQELTGTDWQLDWPETFPDWLVPARQFSYSQKTPIEVIVQIVETAGGRVLADPVLSWLWVRPRYPEPVWDWAETEPDLILPQAIIKTLNWKPRIGKPWDAVYLGDGATVLAKVVRSGQPGASLPDQPIIEPLLCHADACRARGIAFLSDAMAGVDFTLALPLSVVSGPSPLRAVGELVRFEEGGSTWVGLITRLNLQVGLGTAWQTLEVRAVEVPS